MAQWKPAPIVGGAYSDDTKAFSVQDCVNWLPVASESGGTRSGSQLRGVPGLVEFCDLGTGKPIRGLHDAEGRLLAVSGNTLYEISPGGVATSRGTVSGVGRVSMAHNQVTGGNQVGIANGQSGYVFDTSSSTFSSISSSSFPGAISFDYVDSYLTAIEPGRRFAFTSGLADALSYSTLDRYEAEGSPDFLVGQAVTHREWWLFGERTVEPYINTGAAEGTFQRSSGTVIEIGLASPYAVATMDNTVYWLGGDGNVYRANGYSPQRISTHPIEQAIRRCNISQAFAFVWEDEGHMVFYLTFPDGHTWGYDAASQQWHRRQSRGLDKWRINALVKSNGAWIAGDYANGKLYKLDWSAQDEAGESMERRRVSGVLHANHNPMTLNGVALEFDTGQPDGNDSEAFVDFRYSKDGGHNWSNWRKISLGTTGDFVKRVEMRQFGRSRQFVLDVRVTDAVRADLLACELMAETLAA